MTRSGESSHSVVSSAGQVVTQLLCAMDAPSKIVVYAGPSRAAFCIHLNPPGLVV
jgi:hypothetical protein